LAQEPTLSTLHYRLSLLALGGLLQLVRALQRGVLAGDTAGLLMWRLCTPVDEHHRTAVQPSMGRLLASILQRKEPERRLQVRAFPKQQVVRHVCIEKMKLPDTMLRYAQFCCRIEQ
jgi:hypothetical protein